jgi:hypothetical protein
MRSRKIALLQNESISTESRSATTSPNRRVFLSLRLRGFGGPFANRFYLDMRDDIPADECTMERLKFKAKETAE